VSLAFRAPGGDRVEVALDVRDDGVVLARCNDLALELTVEPLGDGRFRLRHAGGVHSVCVDARGATRCVTIEGVGEARLEREAPGRRRRRDAAAGDLSSPMPGTVVKVFVAVGDVVASGQDLLVVEAMKMEIKITATIPGTVRQLHVAAGDPCDAGATLVEIEPEPEAGP